MIPLRKEELGEMIGTNEDFVLVNVLSNEDFKKDNIPSSINIPADDPEFEKKVREVAGSKGRPIVVYCASFECKASPTAARKLDKAGFRNVYDYEGGMKDWNEAGVIEL